MSYIVVEGLDLVGKSTLIESLKPYFKLKVTKEPFEETQEAKKVREGIQSDNIPPIYETQLLVASRIECLNKLKNYLNPKSSMHLISDRNFISNMVYQSKNEQDMERIYRLNKESLDIYGINIIPSLIIYMELPYTEIIKRFQKSVNGREITAKDRKVVQEGVYKNYQEKYKRAIKMILTDNPQTKLVTIYSDYNIQDLAKVISSHLESR